MTSREYWARREEENLRLRQEREDEYFAELERIYRRMYDRCMTQINAFYGKYASAEGISIEEAKKRASKADMEAYARKAAEYVKTRDFSAQANEEMRLYNLTMKVNRLELLKAEVGLEMVDGFNEIDRYTGEILTEEALEVFKDRSGILGQTVTDQGKRAKDIAFASFHNATFSDRIWAYQDLLKNDLSTILERALIGGENAVSLASRLSKRFGVSLSDAERLVRTETTRVFTEAQRQSVIEAGYDKLVYITMGDAKVCAICSPLNGTVFSVDDERIGENAPPMHPNCRCTTAPEMDRNELDRLLTEAGYPPVPDDD